MTREMATIYLMMAIGLFVVVFCVLMLIVVRRKREHFSPFFVFRAYLLFTAVLCFGGYMIVSPFFKGYGISDLLSGGSSDRNDKKRVDNGSVADKAGSKNVTDKKHIEKPPQPKLPEMSRIEAKFLVRDLKSRSRLLRMNAIRKLSRSRPQAVDRQRIIRALQPLVRDRDDRIRSAAQRALASLRQSLAHPSAGRD